MATTTNYSWATPNDSDPFKQGASAIRTLGSAVDTTLYTALGGAYPGLRLVKKQTIASGVTSQAVTDAFSATYENYKILVTGGVASTGTTLLLKLNGITTGYYTSMVYVPFSGTATPAGINQANAAYFNWAGGGSTASLYADIDIQNPFTAKPKVGKGTFLELSTTGNSAASHFYNASTASATAFTIEVFSGTMTGGTIYVYGYGAS
jgi:phosphate-selective porin